MERVIESVWESLLTVRGLFLLALFLGTVVSALTAVFAHGYGDGGDLSTRALFWMTVFAGVWGAFTLFEALAREWAGHGLAVLFAKGSYVGITGCTTAVFVFALLYSGRERFVTRRTLAVLAVEPVLVNLLVWTTEVHGLWYPVVDGVVNLDAHGAAFFVHLAYGYVLIVATVALLLDVVRRQQSLFQRQSFAIGVAALLPVAMNVLEVVGVVSVEITPTAFSLSAVALLWAITRVDLTTLSPVARDRIVHDMNAGALVVNADDIVVDVNPRMKRILGLEPGRDVVGEPVDSLLAGHDEIREHFRKRAPGDGEVPLETDDGTFHYSIEVSPLYDHREHQVGRTFLVHDVTDQKRRQRALRRKNEQLDQFASLVSHDLRNPLNVAEGYLDVAEETGDPEHFEKVREMHERMERLIDDVLTLAREGEEVDETESVELEAVVRAAWAGVETDEATLTTDCRGYALEADWSRLQQVFENLFRNSFDHGVPADGEAADLEVAVGPILPDGESVDPFGRGFYVEDDGIGIPADVRDSVFEHGYTTGEDGTGLGLSIVDQIARAHGWETHVGESEAGGARFEVLGVASLAERPAAREPR